MDEFWAEGDANASSLLSLDVPRHNQLSSHGEHGKLVYSPHAGWSGCRRIEEEEFTGGPAGSEELHFIHIPRTAGTTIESCSPFFPKGWVRWGSMNPQLHGAKQIRLGHEERRQDRQKCYGQHLPPAMFTRGKHPFLPRKNNFCVVRHPYSRLISQFGWANRFSAAGKYECTAATMNAYLEEHLSVVADGNLFADDCHFAPQALFVFDYDNETYAPRRDHPWCSHLLRFEHLDTDFNHLMKRFGYAVELGTWGHSGVGMSNRHMGSDFACRSMNASQFSPEVKALADRIYKEDFDAFGYSPSTLPFG
jgi:hypothetical protein